MVRPKGTISGGFEVLRKGVTVNIIKFESNINHCHKNKNNFKQDQIFKMTKKKKIIPLQIL